MILEVPLSKIKVKERQRKDYGDVRSLAESIAKYGQLQNLLVEPVDESDGTYSLIAGGRRLAGIAASGATAAFIKVWSGESLDDLLLQELELEENVQRKDLTWQEKNDAIANMHKIKATRAQQDGEAWDLDSTARLLNMSRRTVANALELQKARAEHPDVDKADTAFGAMKRLDHIKQMRKREEAVQVRQTAVTLGMAKKHDVECVCMDALEFMRSLPDESQDYVITNPPFGVDIEEVFTSGRAIYEDKEANIAPLCAAVIKEAYRVLREDRWFVVFYPTIRLEECRQFLSEAGFTFAQVPSVWYKPNKHISAISDQFSQLPIQYESFFFARKGNAKFRQVPQHGDVFVFDTPGTDRIHPLQMPPALWDDILALITIRGERGVEPFSGSGSGGVAAVGRDLVYRGAEFNPEFVRRANTWIQETILAGAPVPLPLFPEGNGAGDVSGDVEWGDTEDDGPVPF